MDAGRLPAGEFTLRQLRYFVAAAAAGTTQAAAAEMYVSQSAMSSALAELETALGVDAPGASANVIADAAPDAHAEPDAAARGPAGTVVRRIRGW